MLVIRNPPKKLTEQWLKVNTDKSVEFRQVSLWGQDLIILNFIGEEKRFESVMRDFIDDSSESEILNIQGESPLSGLQLQNAGRVRLSENILLDGQTTVLIAGPCAVESGEQIEAVAHTLSELGLRFLRGGAFKPRTSGYSFQGRGVDGLQDMRSAADRHNLSVVTEVRSETEVEVVAAYSDVIQVGAKSAYNFTLLREAGRTDKPILLKRGFMMTVQEFLQAADVILAEGNGNVVLCERGIRTFETATRFTLDLTSAAKMKRMTHLPIVIDPSHAAGDRSIISDLARAAVALDIDGLMVEVHPAPERALSDSAQAFPLHDLHGLKSSVQRVCEAVGRRLV